MQPDTPAVTPDRAPCPVAAGERYTALDTLRGVAVLGILLMNIYAFAMPVPAYTNPLLMGGAEWYNLATWFATHIVAEQKFLTIFSMLFGAGIVLMWERTAAQGAGFARIYYRRMFWLLLIGMLHGYFIWFGDILFHYALIGMLLYGARKWRPRKLLVVACLLLPVALLTSYGIYAYVADLQARAAEISALQAAGDALSDAQQATLDEWTATAMFVAPSAADIEKDLQAHLGSYGDLLRYRIPVVASLQLSNTFIFMLWRIGGLMLLGMAMMKLGILSGQRDLRTYDRMMLFGYGLGLPLALYSGIDLYAHQFDGLYFLKQGQVANYIGSIAVACGHIGLVMRLVQTGAGRSLIARLAAVGRMAFTNYLLQSIILTTVFYGYGLGLYGQVPRAAQMLFVLGVCGLQISLSAWWLTRYRFGPAEWLWRSLTYGRRQPFKI